ncbi:pfs domain-containing protein [Apiospora arundinis]|uniref:Pfs domain-containing protein n=1 Tax=Apiospora arundinis TaxID=335852 RepID=A0ABR2I941_9PEZI
MSHQDQPVQTSAAPPRSLDHDNYTVAIICPMGDELSPVLALLDEKYESLSTSRDQNAYVLGRMGGHNIVVATMPTIGNNAAAMVVTQLLNDFGRVRFGLLVGVGGGIPDKDYEDDDLHDIRLGDVVVSKSRENFGGVVQFDRGKSTTSDFVRTGHLNRPPHILAGNVEKLKAVHNLHGNNIPRFLDEMLAKYPRMKERYSCPGADWDRLFEAAYTHQGGKSCKNCDNTQVVKRNPHRDSRPRIHYGTIGSSNMVVENTDSRDELRDSMHALCVEMEAAGLMEAFPCLVIRGISDYADSHKNKKWQPYAAATAAAYAKELLLQIPLEAVKHTQPIIEVVFNMRERVNENPERIERRTQSSRENNMLEGSSPRDIDFSALHDTSQRAYSPAIGYRD